MRLERLTAVLGVDSIQWRTLVLLYLRMDFRGSGGAVKPGEFAAFVRLAAGSASWPVWAAAGAAVLLTAACIPLAAGRLSLDYAQRLGETMAIAETPRRRAGLRVPGFRRAEGRAVAVLVAAQFRYDQKFRMAILGIIPLIFFYRSRG